MSFIAFNPCNYLAGLASLFPFLQIKKWVLERLSDRLILMYLIWSDARLWPCVCTISQPLISSVHQADFLNKSHLLNINFSDMHMQYSSLISLKTQIRSQAFTLDLEASFTSSSLPSAVRIFPPLSQIHHSSLPFLHFAYWTLHNGFSESSGP